MNGSSPNVVLLAGPNGSGKTTVAPELLRDYLGISEFVNADVIAQGLSGFNADAVAIRAGRIMVERLRELAKQRVDFAFETTLASRAFASWLDELRRVGYRSHLLFLWLCSPELGVARVAGRVEQGGHPVPEAIIRRRYASGLRNLFQLYLPVVDSWIIFDNSAESDRLPIASRDAAGDVQISHEAIWKELKRQYA